MTTPTATGPQAPATPPRWEVIAQRALDVLAAEKAAVALVAPLRTQLRAVVRAVTAAWVTATGGVHSPTTPHAVDTVLPVLQKRLEDVDPGDLAEQIIAATQDAANLGVAHAVDAVRDQMRRTSTAPAPVHVWGGHPIHVTAELDSLQQRADKPVLDATIRRELSRLDIGIRDRITVAVRDAYRLGATATWSDIQGVALRAQHAATGAEAAAAWLVNYAANQGARHVARALGVECVWISERNACLTCLALSGHVSIHGEFDATATFARRPPPVWPPGLLHQPPRHPRCRCRIETWLGSAPGYSGPDLPAALRREARRSVLSGWRLDSESETARVAAAKTLLAAGVDAPESVKARARRAVVAGSFGARQPFPTTT